MLSADARVETDPFRTTFPVHRPPQSRPLPHPAPKTDLFRGLNTSLRYPGQLHSNSTRGKISVKASAARTSANALAETVLAPNRNKTALDNETFPRHAQPRNRDSHSINRQPQSRNRRRHSRHSHLHSRHRHAQPGNRDLQSGNRQLHPGNRRRQSGNSRKH